MDRVVDKIAALGVPGLVLIVAIAGTGWTGGAAITTALAVLGGPLGMIGGIGTLIVIGLISKALATYGFQRVFAASMLRLCKQGESADSIRTKVTSYPISGRLKRELLRHLDELGGQCGQPSPTGSPTG